MAWPSLVPPTAGTVITAAWESAMVNDPLLWLRLMTGNADPPGNNYVVVSQGIASTAWSKIGPNVLAPGAVVGHLGYTPANKAADTVGDWTLSRSLTGSGASSDGVLYLGQTGGNVWIGKIGNYTYITGATVQINNDVYIYRPSAQNTGYIFLGNGGHHIGSNGVDLIFTGARVWHSGNIPSPYQSTGGTITGDVTVLSPTGLNIIRSTAPTEGYLYFGSPGHFLGYNGSRLVYDGHYVWNGSHQGHGTGMNADLLDGMHAQDIINAAVAAVPPSANPIPTGTIALWEGTTAPTGWVIMTGWAGRFPGQAGGSGITLGGVGGTTAHKHDINHGHSATTAGPSSTSTGGEATPQRSYASTSHSHTVNIDQAGAPVMSAAADIGLPPYVGVNYIKKG